MMLELPPEAWGAALAGLPGMGPARLLALLRRWSPPDAWECVQRREWLRDRATVIAARVDPERLASIWASAAAATDVASVWTRHLDAGIGVAALGSVAYPAPLANDIEPPAVLFMRGDPTVISGPRVAIVGTRGATRYGLELAFELGRDLAAAGVAIVSGLALGIDGAGHAGALDANTAPPIGVVGSGLDVVYPRRHAELWREVERRGVLLSEAPLGAPPERWRFPARNRLIAAIADVVIVVESREMGGSMHTVTEAERRDRVVFAAPGPVRSATSAGTNRLLRDGAHVVCDAGDVLVALGLSSALCRPIHDPRPEPAPQDASVLDALGWSPVSLDGLAVRTLRPLGELALALTRLQEHGWVVERAGWYERAARSER
ncbi:MAG: processing protein [Acidimicrobiaceae bacterium]